jgi:hypothetical protein
VSNYNLVSISESLSGPPKILAIQPKIRSTVEVEHQKQNELDRVDPRILESVKAARIAIGTANKPLQLEALHEYAKANGFQIFTPDPKGTYSARLRDKAHRVGLVFLKGYGWWLSERPYEPANYRPGTPAKRRYSVRRSVGKKLMPRQPVSKAA